MPSKRMPRRFTAAGRRRLDRRTHGRPHARERDGRRAAAAGFRNIHRAHRSFGGGVASSFATPAAAPASSGSKVGWEAACSNHSMRTTDRVSWKWDASAFGSRPRRLCFTWRNANFAPHEQTAVEVEFAAVASGTLVTVTHSGLAALREDHPARHGLQGTGFSRLIGLWWGEQMTSLRRVCASSGS